MSKQTNRTLWKSRPVIICGAVGALVGLVWVLVNSVHAITTDEHGYQGIAALSWVFGVAFAELVAGIVGGLVGGLVGRGLTALRRDNGRR